MMYNWPTFDTSCSYFAIKNAQIIHPHKKGTIGHPKYGRGYLYVAAILL